MKQRRKSTSSAGVSLANQFRRRVNGKLKPICDGSGQSLPVSSVYYDPDTFLWKTSQDSSLKGWGSSLAVFPRSGTMRNGIVCRRQPSVPPTFAIESSSLPTPSARPYGRNRSASAGAAIRPSLGQMAKTGMWPTPQAHDAAKGDAKRVGRYGTKHGGRNLNDEVGGQLNPAWVEWLMGFPLGFTDLED